ncbi:MAG TPA: DUF167 domain-containing protein [Candidatus Acidoferrum sp.]|nr:DUF167 domain-containing protein [Candidatus Acidoferrum sp.]
MSARLEIIAKPGSRNAGIVRRGEEIVVAVRARALEGQANEAIVHAVAKWLTIAPSRVRLLRGTSGRRKLLLLDGVGDVELRARIDDLRRE